jgi:hypothetical protein
VFDSVHVAEVVIRCKRQNRSRPVQGNTAQPSGRNKGQRDKLPTPWRPTRCCDPVPFCREAFRERSLRNERSLAVTHDLLLRSAWHEAGHVIAALAQDGIIRFAQIYPEPVQVGPNGLTGLTRVAMPIDTDTPFKTAVRCLCGPLAEQRLVGGPIDDCADLVTARALMKQARMDLAHADHAARLLLRHQTYHVEIIAEALLERRILRDHDVRVLVPGF